MALQFMAMRFLRWLPKRLVGLHKPGLAEVACAAVALACFLLPEWWTLSRNHEQREGELHAALRTTVETTRHSLRAWGQGGVVEVSRLIERSGASALALEILADSEKDPAERSLAAIGELRRLLLSPSAGLEQAWNWAPSGVALLRADGTALRLTPRGGRAAKLSTERLKVFEAVFDGSADFAPAARLAGLFGDSNDWALAVGVPLRDRSGSVAAVLAVRLRPREELSRRIAGRSLGRSGRTYLFSEDGAWLAVSNSGRSSPEVECGVSARDLVAAAGGGSEPEQGLPRSSGVNLEGFKNCSGVRAVAAWDSLPEMGLGLLTEISEEEAYQAVHSARLAALLLAVPLGACLLFLIVLQTSGDTAPETKRRQPRRNTAAWGILVVSLITTGMAWLTAKSKFEEYDRANFEQACGRVRDSLSGRLERCSQALTVAAGAVQALPPGGTRAWGAFVRAADFERTHPALLSLALLERNGADLKALGWEPFGNAPSRAEDDVQRLDAMQAALRTALGRFRYGANLTAFPAPADETGERPRELIALKPAPLKTSADAKREYWVVARIDLSELTREVENGSGAAISFALLSDKDLDAEDLILESPDGLEAARDASASGGVFTLPVEFGDRFWSLAFTHAAGFAPSLTQDYPAQVLLGGLAISVLLFDIALVLSSTRARALGIAELMTLRFRDGEERIRAVIDSAPDGVVTFDSQGRIQSFNPWAERLFGYSAKEASGARISRLLPVLSLAEVTRLASQPLEDAQQCEARRKDGSVFPAELTVSDMQIGEATMYTAIVRDVSARRQAEEALRESEERYALAARGANDGLWDWNLKTNEVYYSERWRAMIGAGDDELGASPEEWFERIHSDDTARFRELLDDHLAARSAHFECEYRIRRGDGGYIWALCRGIAVRDSSGRATRMAGSQTDVTERKQAEKQLIHEALHDPLTGMPNRAYFMTQLESVRETARSQGGALFALLFLDLDRFKVVNDSLGHIVGDQLLVDISKRLKSCLRPGDAICRLGGDEFAILVTNLQSADDATRIADRIHHELENPVRIGEREVFVSVSIGIALGSADDQAPEDLLRDADTAMYRAKASGRSRHELFDQGMHTMAVKRLQLETDLRHALSRGELCVYYQPIISLAEKKIAGCEALLRWDHPSRGLLRPIEFISLAEETGMINPIGEWLLGVACGQVQAWRKAGLPPISLSVNVSPRQLLEQDLVEVVDRALAEHDLDPKLLQLELTESALMESSEETIRPLVELHGRGVRIALDDFGTGYSSLIYLRRFPINIIKIDQSFIQHVPEDVSDSAIASGLIALAHSLDLTVVVEGVERPEQLAFLIEKNCDQVQGYVFSRPVPAEEFARLLADGVSLEAFSMVETA